LRSRFETDDTNAAHAAVLAGLGLGVLPRHVAADDLRLGRLVSLSPDVQLMPDIGINLVHLPNRRLALRVRTLAGVLVEGPISAAWPHCPRTRPATRAGT
jgi:DNA-binding transcriptional LysR family regulator